MAVRFFFCAWAIGILALLAAPQLLLGGGPRTIAGTSYFDPAVKGTPLTWSQGVVSYYTDRGNLSPALPGASADAFVADAFNHWTSISTVAVSAVKAGPAGGRCERRERERVRRSHYATRRYSAIGGGLSGRHCL
jgi:hypothetical protein